VTVPVLSACAYQEALSLVEALSATRLVLLAHFSATANPNQRVRVNASWY
jgi:hypothetical protein